MAMRHSWLIGVGLCLAVAAPGFANDSPSYSYKSPEVSGDQMAKVRVALDAKDWAGAIAILFPLSQSDPRNADVENLLGYSYRMLGQYPQAFLYYDKALALDPKHKGALEYEGEAYLETDQLPKAEVNLSRLKTACAGGCEEITMLRSAIDRYKAKSKIN
jgi:tetratricopeptide (TPR) repeat protein